ncbi:MAG: Virginiamycin B lyase [bacterium]|nr:Virginiamycin B lyase [bacterium]
MLQWDRLEVRDLQGFRIHRRVMGQSRFSPIALTAPTANSFREFGVNYGLQHVYRITAVAAAFESSFSDSAMITPGPTFSWVADVSAGDLVQLSHDGSHEISRSTVFGRPLRLKVDARRGSVWVIDRFGGDFGRLNMSGKRFNTDKRIYGPAGLAIDHADGSVWVADTLTFGLMKFDSTGTLIHANESFKKLAAFAVHPATSELWALDRATTSVLIFSRLGELRRISNVALQRPFDLAIDARTGKVWIADGNRILRLDERGEAETLVTPPLRRAYRVAADEATGGCWLIDYSTAIRNSNVIKIQANGAIAFTISGFDIPERLAVNPFDGSCLVADYGNGRIVRLSADGRDLSSYDRLAAPVDVDTAP